MGKRQEQRILTLEEVAKVPSGDIIKEEDLTPPAFPKPEVSQLGELVPDATEEMRVAWQATKDARAQWEAEKAEFSLKAGQTIRLNGELAASILQEPRL